MRRQRAPAGAAFCDLVAAQVRIALLRPGLTLGDGGLEILEAELQLLVRQALGFGAELHPLQLHQQMVQPLGAGQQCITLHRHGVQLGRNMIAFRDGAVALRHGRPQQGTQSGGAFGRIGIEAEVSRITVQILCCGRRRGNPPHGLNPRPVEAVEQGCERHRRQPHHPIYNRWPLEGALLQLLPDQNQPAAVPHQQLHPVCPLGTIDDHHTRKRIFPQHLGRQRRQAMRALAEVDWPRGKQNPHAGRNADHASHADARTARSTDVSSAPSVPGATRTTAPASLTSIMAVNTG